MQSQTPKNADLLSTARVLHGFFDERSTQNEDEGALTQETVSVLRDGGFFSLLVPRERGGYEASPTCAIEVVEELSRADGSPSWVVLACNVATAAAAAYLAPDVSAKLFSGVRPIIAGQGAPNGRAVVDGRGFRLSGRWNYGSGILHADHVHACAIIMENGAPRRLPSGDPEMRMFIVPPENVELHRDWDVLGLRATASIDYSINDAYVPAEYTYPARVSEPAAGGNLYRIGITGLALIGHTGFALGTARRALDEISNVARDSMRGPRNMGNSDKFLQDFGAAEAALCGARAFVFDAWRQAESTLAEGLSLDTRRVTLLRLALVHATKIAADVCEFAYRAAGGRSLRRSAIQRCLRDILAAAQHIHVSPAILTECGREIAGLAPEASWGAFALVAKRSAGATA